MSAAFDTLAAVRDMEAAGMDRKAAEAVAGAIRAGQGDLATKTDLDALRSATKTDLAALEGRMTATLYRALWVQAVGIVGAIAATAGVAVALASLIGSAAP